MASILVVDDDDVVRQLTRRILETHGYEVYTAANGMQAMLVCEEHPDDVWLLVAATCLPDMMGAELAKLASTSQPHMAVLLTVGASQPPPAPDALRKPFTTQDLISQVRDKLDAALEDRLASE